MPAVVRNTHGDGDSGLSTPEVAVVCIASAALIFGLSPMPHNAAENIVTDLRVTTPVTLGTLGWRFIVWRRDKDPPLAPASTKFSPPPPTAVHLPQESTLTHLADTEKGQDYTSRIPPPPPAYSPGLVRSSPASNKKSTPALILNVADFDTEETRPSPLRPVSFNPSPKTQSWSSRATSRMSTGAKKLYAHLHGRYSTQRRLDLKHLLLQQPQIDDRVPRFTFHP
jgi:hypothetical protein